MPLIKDLKDERLKFSSPGMYRDSLRAALSAKEDLETRLKGYEAEKFRRMYYQGIVYAVCLWIDSIEGNAAGHGVVCGTYETPSEGVEEALERIGEKLKGRGE